MLNITPKLWLSVVLSAAILALGACADKDSATTQDDVNPAAADPQTQIEQQATGVDDVEQVVEGVNSADISDDPLVTEDVAVATADGDVAVATVDDSEILDGSESQEHVSTY